MGQRPTRDDGSGAAPLLVFDMNPIAGFVGDALVYGPGYSAILSGKDGQKVPLHEALSDKLVNVGVGDGLASLVYSALAVAFVWTLLLVLSKRRLFLRV
jgi:hypothetical protein